MNHYRVQGAGAVAVCTAVYCIKDELAART